MTTFDWISMAAKMGAILVVMIHVAPIMAWVERRGSALMQQRLGPNRIGPLGLLQSAADGIKFIFKEDVIPGHVDKIWYLLAPIISFIPALIGFAVVPFGSSLDLGDGRIINFQLTNLDSGVLYVLAIASLGVYGIIMGGWASNNKYALLGSLRSSSQMISYELSMGLAVVAVLMTFNTVQLSQIAAMQGQALVHLNLPVLGEIIIRKYGIFLQPLGALIFIVAAFAETNRLPFDLPEGESEIVAGYHLEYGSMKFAMFMMAEYINMFTASALISTFYFGGWQILPGVSYLFAHSGLEGMTREVVRVALEVASFGTKVGFFMWFFVWVRWTLPRFRYDQLMDLGWKVMLPLSIINIVATGALAYLGVI
jgi:NADH-quinone oxidoreductase subunit H